MKSLKPILFFILLMNILVIPIFASDPHPQKDLGKATEAIINPISETWDFNFEYDFIISDGKSTQQRRYANILTFKPRISFPLGEDWDLVNRITLPIPIEDVQQADNSWSWDGGLGDISLVQILSPIKGVDSLNIIGAGWTWTFPTASEDTLGDGKYKLGPAAVIGKMTDKYQVAVLLEQWWSIGGDGERKDTSEMNIEYWLEWFVTPTFTIGMNPTITADWKENIDNRWTLPVGIGCSKTVSIGNIPVNFAVEVDYSIICPKSFGEKWDISFTITPVIDNPFKRKIPEVKS